MLLWKRTLGRVTYFIGMFEFKLILSQSQSKSTRCVLENINACVGCGPFDDHLDCRIIVVEKNRRTIVGFWCVTWDIVNGFLARVWMFFGLSWREEFLLEGQGMRQAISQTKPLLHSSHWKTTDNIVYVRNKASDCKLGLIQDSDWAGDTKSTSGKVLCISKAKTFVPIFMAK